MLEPLRMLTRARGAVRVGEGCGSRFDARCTQQVDKGPMDQALHAHTLRVVSSDQQTGAHMVRRILRTAGKAALISGTATAVAGRVARHQNQKLAKAHAPQPDTRPARKPSQSHLDIAESLQLLASLKA